ncbi:hypothetical protein [Celeribacter baekdonensis]|jgi:hypothetical protein|uniref:hypothetical protein n=1 Tax=Celeribacter baekdonensis TaxID=875171 RepID=UPI0030D8B2DC|tara:strand:+ start:1539 stop:1847 length:309 start_codon:yes stop_codon:yes gene_type:complete
MPPSFTPLKIEAAELRIVNLPLVTPFKVSNQTLSDKTFPILTLPAPRRSVPGGNSARHPRADCIRSTGRFGRTSEPACGVAISLCKGAWFDRTQAAYLLGTG